MRAFSDRSITTCECRLFAMGCIVCRCVIWILWCFVAMPLRMIETLIFAAPADYIKHEVQRDREGFGAMLAGGLFLTYTTFLPLARMQALDPGCLCTVYLSLVSWVVGHLIMNILLFAGVCSRIQLSHHCVCLQTGISRLRDISGGGYIGLMMGISLAFPIASMRHINDSFESQTLHEWCRPTDEVPAVFVCLPLFVIGMIAENIVGMTPMIMIPMRCEEDNSDDEFS